MKDVSEKELVSNPPLRALNDPVTFWVPGKPIGQGRISTINGHSFHSNGKTLNPWRRTVNLCARDAKLPILEGAVEIHLKFVLERGKTVTRAMPTITPDLDHYVRAVNDALKGVAFTDDSQVCRIVATKTYGANQGVEISVGCFLQTP